MSLGMFLRVLRSYGDIKTDLLTLSVELVYFLTIKKDKHYVDKTRSNRNEVWFRGNNVRGKQVIFKAVRLTKPIRLGW